jgi:MFS family permease
VARALHTDQSLLSRAETWALIGCQPLPQLANMALLPSLGAMRADLGLSYAELGWVVATFGIARLVVDLPAGNLAARWNPRSVLISALGLSIVGSVAGVFAANAWQIASIRLLIGVGSAVAQAMLLAWIVGGSGRAGRGRVLSQSEAFFSLTGLVVPALGGLLATSLLGWRGAFVLGAAAGSIGLLAIVLGTRPSSAAHAVGLSMTGESSAHPARARLARPGARGNGGAKTARWSELRSGGKVLLAAYLATFVVFFCRNGMLNAVLPVLGAERFNFQPLEIGLLFSVINAIGIGAVLLGGRWADRFGRYHILAPGLAVLALAQALVFAAHTPLTYIAVGLVQGLACFVNPLPTIVMGDALSPRLRARGIAVYRAVCDVAILSAPASLGIAVQSAGFGAAELLNLTVCLIGFGGVWLLYSASRSRTVSMPASVGEASR